MVKDQDAPEPESVSGPPALREQPETVKVQATPVRAPVPLPQAPEPVVQEPEPDPEPTPEPTGSKHQPLTGGPAGATGWCEGCQQYCGGQNGGTQITCDRHPY
jgi:hypothetical protein